MIKVGDFIKGVVTGIEKYGIFVSCEDGYNGLIHISEISDGFVKNIEDFVSLKEEIMVRVLDMDSEHKKLKLSIKNENYRLQDIQDAATDGFAPLKKQLPKWTEEALQEMGDSNEL